MKIKIFESAAQPEHAGCEGLCKNCGKAHIKILGHRDDAMKALSERVQQALALFPMNHKLIETTEPGALQASGIETFPALLLDGMLMSEGETPAIEDIVEMFRNRYLYHSKLYRLHAIAVPTDLSAISGNALRFAWKIAAQVGADIEVMHAMDSIFEGQYPSASGFLSSYKKTVQQELNDFIRETLKPLGVAWEPHAKTPGAPGEKNEKKSTPQIHAKVTYGFPDRTIEEFSLDVDLIVMATTGRGALSEKLFGSVATEVSKYAHCPVLFVPQNVEFRDFKNILYAGNFESLDLLRIRQAVAFARRFDSQIHFVHVGPAGEEGLELEQKLFEIDYSEARPDKPFIFSKMIDNDDVTNALYDYAMYHRIELLVFVTHRRSFWENFLHHSITRKALLTGDLPMLVLHSDDDMICGVQDRLSASVKL
jgi:nucleotide-binding universal stress UspA family protein